MESSSVPQSWQQQQDDENGQALLPGFRFHPTEEELVGFYLRRRLHNKQTNFRILIQDLDLYSHEPWDLPGLAAVGEAETEWFFFVSFASRLHMDGRPSRITPTGYWKATGTEKPVYSHSPHCHLLGWKKTLVFYKGRAPVGHKTDWVMNEYRFHHTDEAEEKEADIRLCRVYKKASLARSFDRRPTIHVERQLHNGHPSPFEYQTPIYSQVEIDSSQQSSHTMNEGGVQDAEAEKSGSLSPLWHYSP